MLTKLMNPLFGNFNKTITVMLKIGSLCGNAIYDTYGNEHICSELKYIILEH